jgi:prepilin-type N-terminal cleavage/methylation domain-containing protein
MAITSKSTTRRDGRTQRQAGFTLMELILVIGMMVVLAGIALPGIAQLFTGGAFARARNTLTTQLAMARAIAVRQNTYAGVHVQPADGTTDRDLRDTVWSGIVIYDAAQGWFTQRDDDQAQRLPGHVGFGELHGRFLDGDSYDGVALNAAGFQDFTRFTIVFSPTGRLVTEVEGDDVKFNPAAPAFAGGTKIWNMPAEEPAAEAVTVFDYAELKALSAANRAKVLNAGGVFIGLNPYNGQLLAPQ